MLAGSLNKLVNPSIERGQGPILSIHPPLCPPCYSKDTRFIKITMVSTMVSNRPALFPMWSTRLPFCPPRAPRRQWLSCVRRCAPCLRQGPPSRVYEVGELFPTFSVSAVLTMPPSYGGVSMNFETHYVTVWCPLAFLLKPSKKVPHMPICGICSCTGKSLDRMEFGQVPLKLSSLLVSVCADLRSPLLLVLNSLPEFPNFTHFLGWPF